MAALAAAEKEAAELAEREAEADAVTAGGIADDDGVDDRELDVEDEEPGEERGADDDTAVEPAAPAAEEEPPGFWEEVGIDPIRIVTGDGDLLTLRCYLDDRPVFLGVGGQIDTFPTRGALMRFVATGAEGNAMAEVSTWPDVVERAAARELEVEIDPLNVYVLPGLEDDLAEGPTAVDPTQLEQAVELVRDVGEWAGDDEPRMALAESQSLGWLAVVRDPTRPDPHRAQPALRGRRREVAGAGRRAGEAARPPLGRNCAGRPRLARSAAWTRRGRIDHCVRHRARRSPA